MGAHAAGDHRQIHIGLETSLGRFAHDVVHVPELFLDDFRALPGDSDMAVVVESDGSLFNDPHGGFNGLVCENEIVVGFVADASLPRPSAIMPMGSFQLLARAFLMGLVEASSGVLPRFIRLRMTPLEL